MNKIAYDALVASYHKWRQNLENIKDKEGQWVDKELYRYCVFDCPLCFHFAMQGAYGCGGCPIKEKTGVRSCQDTPYQRIYIEVSPNNETRSKIYVTKELITQTRNEVQFLGSLIPKGGPDE